MRFLPLLLIIPIVIAGAASLIPTESATIDICFTQQEECANRLFSKITQGTRCAIYRTDYPTAFSKARVVVDKDEHDITQARPVDISGLMHHKFCVTNDTVITGSTNPTAEGFHDNDNNLIIITSPRLAKAYQSRWERLVLSDLSASSVSTYGRDMDITVHFCHETCIDAIITQIRKARHSVHFMVFTFTHPRVAHALIEAHQTNITVSGVVERRSASRDVFDLLTFQGIDITQDANPATLHHKTFIIDDETIITGSFNPTKSADTINAEDLLIIRNRQVAQRYLAEWERVYALAKQQNDTMPMPNT